MAANPFSTIRQAAEDKDRSVQWYQAQVRKLGTVNTNALMRQGTLTTKLYPGYMYLYGYDPKLKDTLPFYDKFPLVLPFRRVPDGFYGLNLHYLPYMMRFKMLGMLHEYITDATASEKTRLRVSWRLLESSAKLKPIRACVKHYLFDHVRTRFLMIPYTDWVIASQLPVERFVGASKEEVWKDTRKRYR